MKKHEFLEKLKSQLWAMPEADKKRSVDYYAEMIDDRMEDGLSEEKAVEAIGDLDEIIKQILTESPRPPAKVNHAQGEQTQQEQQKQQKQHGMETWMIVLLVLGAPLWIPLLASAAGTVISIYVSLWSVVIALYASTLALFAASLGCVLGSFFMIGSIGTVMVAWGAALLCAGLGILFFMLSNLAAKGMIKLTKLAWETCKNICKNIFKGKEQSV